MKRQNVRGRRAAAEYVAGERDTGIMATLPREDRERVRDAWADYVSSEIARFELHDDNGAAGVVRYGEDSPLRDHPQFPYAGPVWAVAPVVTTELMQWWESGNERLNLGQYAARWVAERAAAEHERVVDITRAERDGALRGWTVDALTTALLAADVATVRMCERVAREYVDGDAAGDALAAVVYGCGQSAVGRRRGDALIAIIERGASPVAESVPAEWVEVGGEMVEVF